MAHDDMMKKMMGKDQGYDDQYEKDKMGAKMEVLEELRKMAMGMMGEGMDKYGSDEMQKITVASPDKEGLMEGLDKAEDMMDSMPAEEGYKPAEEMGESAYEGDSEYMPEDMMAGDEEYEEEYESAEDIDRKIAELEEMKLKMRG